LNGKYRAAGGNDCMLCKFHVYFLHVCVEERCETRGRSSVSPFEILGLLALVIGWPEPFGLVVIEAMTCGTPVIAFPFDSVPELIEPGVTGALVERRTTAEKRHPAAWLDRTGLDGSEPR
jgi:glycosyltransferase involved in cell wall biosynthesis